jgi:UDP-N-acetylglucosamine acyltransferase
MEGARTGKELQYFFRAVISAVLRNLVEKSPAIIGDNCTIRECVTNRGTIASGQPT